MDGFRSTATRRGATPSPVYEDFEPPLEWVKEDDAETLLISLPGFKKEMLKVQITSARNLKVSGERLIGERKWRRFTKEFPIIPNCDTNQIASKFEDSKLYVKLPKKEAPPSPSRATPHVKLPHEAATSAIRKTEDKLAEDKIPSARVSQQNKTYGSEKASKKEENKTSGSDAVAGVVKDRAQVQDMGFKINPRKVVNLGLIALFLLVLVLYVKNKFKSIEESTIGEL